MSSGVNEGLCGSTVSIDCAVVGAVKLTSVLSQNVPRTVHNSQNHQTRVVTRAPHLRKLVAKMAMRDTRVSAIQSNSVRARSAGNGKLKCLYAGSFALRPVFVRLMNPCCNR